MFADEYGYLWLTAMKIDCYDYRVLLSPIKKPGVERVELHGWVMVEDSRRV